MTIELSNDEIFLIEYINKHYWFGLFMHAQLLSNKEDEERFRDILQELSRKIEEKKK